MKKTFKRSIYTKNDAGNAFIFSILFPILLLIPLMVIAYPIIFSITNDKGFSEKIVSLISAQAGMFLVYYLYNKNLDMNSKKASSFSFKMKWLNILISVVIGFIALYGFNSLIGVFDELISKMVNKPPTPLPFPLHTIPWLIFNLFALAVLPAITEELVFRGIIYNGLKQYGKVIAIVGSSLLFALIHGNIEQIIYPILFGLVLAYIVYKTDNIIYSMVAHFINNGVIVFINYLSNTGKIIFDTSTSVLNVVDILGAIAYTIIAFAAIWALSKLLKKNEVKEAKIKIEEMSDDELIKKLEEMKNNSNLSDTEKLENVDDKTWEKIYCQANDIKAIEKAQLAPNILLWAGVGISLLMLIVQLF